MLCFFVEDPNTSGFIWDELKKMQKQADDRRQMKEQAECIEIEDDDDDVQVTYARSVSAAPQNFKPLRTSSRHSSENLDPPCGTRELTNRAKAVLLQFQKMFGSEGVSVKLPATSFIAWDSIHCNCLFAGLHEHQRQWEASDRHHVVSRSG